MSRKKKNFILWAIIASESSHIFCCVLPTLFSLLGILTNLGMFAMPAAFVAFHAQLHAYEFPIVIFSGTVLAFGWALHWHSLRGEECEHGCLHHTDAKHPTVSRTHMILKVATILFVVNVFVFLVIHRGLGITPHAFVQEAHMAAVAR